MLKAERIKMKIETPKHKYSVRAEIAGVGKIQHVIKAEDVFEVQKKIKKAYPGKPILNLSTRLERTNQ